MELIRIMTANHCYCTHTHTHGHILQENKIVNSVSTASVVCNVNNEERIENCI